MSVAATAPAAPVTIWHHERWVGLALLSTAAAWVLLLATPERDMAFPALLIGFTAGLIPARKAPTRSMRIAGRACVAMAVAALVTLQAIQAVTLL